MNKSLGKIQTAAKLLSFSIAISLVLVAGCNNDSDSSQIILETPTSFNDGIQVGSLESQSIDKALIKSMLEAIDRGDFTGIDSVQIMRNSVLVLDVLIRDELGGHDSFIGNTDLNVHSMQSVSKSFASALLGIAIDQGYINSVDDRLLDYFPEYDQIDHFDERKNNWTIRDFLTMQTGLEWDEWSAPYASDANSLGFLYRNHNDYVKGLFDLPMKSEPGGEYAYSTIASVVLGALVENATGMRLASFADTYLFAPLQSSSAIWALTPVGRAHTGGGLWLSTRDMIKFGQLFLQQGEWQGNQIISKAWVEQSTSQKVLLAQHPDWEGYAYQWWNDNFSLNGELLGIYSAKGNGGQFIFVWPDKDAVIVFTGQNYDSPDLYQPHEMMKQFVIPAF